jgi:DMSO/TMAO reductase YedYZ molybdopterin-dependent catalytic subunit
MKNTKKIFHTFLLILSIFLIFSISGCLQQTIHLKGVELREYQGQKLSSINDFHENSIKGPQYINNTTYRLHITGLVDNPKNFTIDEIINNHHHIKKIATLNCVEGWSVTILWEGVLVKDLLNETKLNSSGKIILFKAYDGYTTSFPISYIMNNSIILAYKMNNITIPPERGYPFQLVAEGKWGYKWIKWVTEIEVTNSTQLSGYWENRGYSDSGDLNASYIG